jgi:hypothetical protein
MINDYDDFFASYSTCASEIGLSAPTVKQVLDALPTTLAKEADIWGWTDTVVRDDLYKLMWTLQ